MKSRHHPRAIKGRAIARSAKLRSRTDPSSQKIISLKAKGLGDKFIARDVNETARLLSATPARISVKGVVSRRLIISRMNIVMLAVTIAASGVAKKNRDPHPK